MANTKLPARLLDTSAVPTLNVTGDLTVDTTTLKVDSTNNRVGIGIASPGSMLHLYDGGTDTKITVQSRVAADATASLLLMSRLADNSNKNVTLQAYRGNLSITGDSGYGRVGIGTTTNYAGNAMAYQLTVDSATASGSVFEAHRTANSRVEMYQNATGGFYIDALGTTPFLQLRTGGSDRLLIDNAGRHYIGKGASNLATSGIELNPGGYLQVTESQSPALYLSRLTDDGNIINFYKTANLMGQIGTYGGALYIGGGTGSNGAGLMFNGTDIEPTTGSTGRTDGAISLGSTNFGLKSVVLSKLGLGQTESANSVGSGTSAVEGIFWHSSKSDYHIGRTAGAWSGPNYQQLMLDWDTGVIIDGGTAYGKSGVEIRGPIASSNGGMVLQTQEAYNSTAVTTSGSGVTVVTTTITVLANSRLAVWFNSGQILSAGNLSNPNFEIQIDGVSISDQNSNHYWYDTGKGTSGRVFMQGQAISGALSAGTRTVRVIGNVYNGSATFNYQSQGAHLIIQEISKDL